MRSWPFCVWIPHTCGWRGHQAIPRPSREHSSRWQGSQKRERRSCSWGVLRNWCETPVQSCWKSNRNATTSTHAQPSLPVLKRCFLKTHSYSDSSLLAASGFYHFAFPCRPFRLPPSIWGNSRSMGPWRLDEILNTKSFSLFLSNCQMLPPGSIFPGGSQV